VVAAGWCRGGWEATGRVDWARLRSPESRRSARCSEGDGRTGPGRGVAGRAGATSGRQRGPSVLGRPGARLLRVVAGHHSRASTNQEVRPRRGWCPATTREERTRGSGRPAPRQLMGGDRGQSQHPASLEAAEATPPFGGARDPRFPSPSEQPSLSRIRRAARGRPRLPRHVPSHPSSSDRLTAHRERGADSRRATLGQASRRFKAASAAECANNQLRAASNPLSERRQPGPGSPTAARRARRPHWGEAPRRAPGRWPPRSAPR